MKIVATVLLLSPLFVYCASGLYGNTISLQPLPDGSIRAMACIDEGYPIELPAGERYTREFKKSLFDKMVHTALKPGKTHAKIVFLNETLDDKPDAVRRTLELKLIPISPEAQKIPDWLRNFILQEAKYYNNLVQSYDKFPERPYEIESIELRVFASHKDHTDRFKWHLDDGETDRFVTELGLFIPLYGIGTPYYEPKKNSSPLTKDQIERGIPPSDYSIVDKGNLLFADMKNFYHAIYRSKKAFDRMSLFIFWARPKAKLPMKKEPERMIKNKSTDLY